jgi:glycosyltransferase involved in cell wall biosynthesis
VFKDMQTLSRVLMIAHNDVTSPTFGGIEVYIKNLKRSFSERHEVYSYIPRNLGPHGVTQVLDSQDHVIDSIEWKTPFTNWELSNNEREYAFSELLIKHRIQLVHIHHLSGHPPALATVAKNLGIPVIYSAHDYFGICHVSNLLNDKDKYCHPETLEMKDCDNCLHSQYGILDGSQLTRRAYWEELLLSLDGLIFNTIGSVRLFQNIYPLLATHPQISLMPVAIERRNRDLSNKLHSNRLQVAIIGHFIEHKGAKAILAAINALASEEIDFHIFGSIDEKYIDVLDPHVNKTVFLYGIYPPGEFPEAFFGCSVSLHLSTCPETYGLTLSESVSAGMVPIATSLGALGERITHEHNGILVSESSSDEIIQALRRLQANRDELADYQKSTISIPIAYLDQHTRELSNLYELLMNKAAHYKEGINTAEWVSNPISSNRKLHNVFWAKFPANDLSSKKDQNIFKRMGNWFRN